MTFLYCSVAVLEDVLWIKIYITRATNVKCFSI